MTPTFSVLRIEGSGNVYTYAGTARYGNGQTWDIIAIIELRDGKIAKSTTWYAAPFEAPENGVRRSSNASTHPATRASSQGA